MKILTFTIVSLSLISTSHLFGQEKKISKNKVSLVIHEYIKVNYPSASKIKFYQESEDGKTFIESQFKFNNDTYYLKFQNDVIEEVEVLLPFKEIPENVQIAIKAELDKLFSHYKIEECQEVNPNSNAMYEIIIESRVAKTSGNFELYFDKSGKLLDKKEIISKPIPSQF